MKIWRALPSLQNGQRTSEKCQRRCICPLNPPFWNAAGYILGDLNFRIPQIWGEGGRFGRQFLLFRHPLRVFFLPDPLHSTGHQLLFSKLDIRFRLLCIFNKEHGNLGDRSDCSIHSIWLGAT
jgi:hypothetical protein